MISNKLIIICGSTATGKTQLGIKLAKKFNGEIISADSRQVYKYMDIGTGKDINGSRYTACGIQLNKNITIGYYTKDGIRIWGLDLIEPDYPFNVGDYKKVAEIIINDIVQRKKIPFIVGGTGLYIKALLEPMNYINIPPDEKLREVLKYQSIKVLKEKLNKSDPLRFDKMNNSDRNNPRRLIRAIEIANYLRMNPKLHYDTVQYHSGVLMIGLKEDSEILNELIDKRVEKRIIDGMVNEVKNLLRKRYAVLLPSMTGLGYKQIIKYLTKQTTFDSAVGDWKVKEHDYAKRQMVWFKKIKNIVWFDLNKRGFYTIISKLICEYLKRTS